MSGKIRSLYLVDPELMPMIEALPLFKFSLEALPKIRQATYSAFSNTFVDPPIAPVEKVVGGLDGPVTVFWYDPSPGAKGRSALLHIHGGGMVLGSARRMQHVPSQYAAALGVPVASVNYRLAPECPFPGPQEDCYAALSWLANSATELGIDPHRIGVIGESAATLDIYF